MDYNLFFMKMNLSNELDLFFYCREIFEVSYYITLKSDLLFSEFNPVQVTLIVGMLN